MEVTTHGGHQTFWRVKRSAARSLRQRNNRLPRRDLPRDRFRKLDIRDHVPHEDRHSNERCCMTINSFTLDGPVNSKSCTGLTNEEGELSLTDSSPSILRFTVEDLALFNPVLCCCVALTSSPLEWPLGQAPFLPASRLYRKHRAVGSVNPRPATHAGSPIALIGHRAVWHSTTRNLQPGGKARPLHHG